MDDFNLSSLEESRNELVARLVNILTPHITEGFSSIYKEACQMCIANEEEEKYLMTFQNLISRVPKWNNELVQVESKRILEQSGCSYIEDLITCVHILKLKALTCVRVGERHKKIDIQIPKFSEFIHKVYINTARKLYVSIYLFEKDIPPLQVQKNNREINIVIKECIVNTVRDNIPVEDILKSYLDESIEETYDTYDGPVNIPPHENNIVKNEINEIVTSGVEPQITLKTNDNISIDESSDNVKTDLPIVSLEPFDQSDEKTLRFSEVDHTLTSTNEEREEVVSKNIEELERISEQRAEKRRLEEMGEDEEETLKIFDDNVTVEFDEFEPTPSKSAPSHTSSDPLLDDIEILS